MQQRANLQIKLDTNTYRVEESPLYHDVAVMLGTLHSRGQCLLVCRQHAAALAIPGREGARRLRLPVHAPR